MVKILIVKTSALGDIVHLFPTIAFLKEIHPDCEIDWVVEEPCSALVEANPHINQVIPVRSKKWRKECLSLATWAEIRTAIRTLRAKEYDVVFDFQGNIKSGLFTFFAKSRCKVGFGKSTVSETPNRLFTNLQVDPPSGLNVRNEYIALAEAWGQKKAHYLASTLLRLTDAEKTQLNRLLQQRVLNRNIMVCPGSNWPNKQLAPGSLTGLLKRIDGNMSCKFWLIYGTAAEKKRVEAMQGQLKDAIVVEKLSLPLLQNLMAHMDQVIAVDSVALHLAGEAEVATFAVFGPSLAAKFSPFGPNHCTVQGRCPYGKVFPRRCNILRSCSTGACIHDLEVDQLYTKYMQTFPCEN